MVIPRYKLLPEGQDGKFHCISRCVRRAHLCGWDSYSNKNFDYRKIWIRNRLKTLSSVFAIDVVGYSLLGNHLHTLLWVRPEKVTSWTDQDIARRWLQICPVRKDHHGIPLEPTEQEIDIIISNPEKIKELRKRLMSISWFNRFLKENIAKRANLEDGCTGRFWEGRFKSIALLNEAAILACLQYIDLNPIRAGIADTPEKSNFTSAQDLIIARQARNKLSKFKEENEPLKKNKKKTMTPEQVELILKAQEDANRDTWLSPLKRYTSEDEKGILNLSCDEYLELLDWTGRQLRNDKKGHILKNLETILVRLEIETDEWLNTVKNFGSLFYRAAGSVKTILKAAQQASQKWLKGRTAARTAFG